MLSRRKTQQQPLRKRRPTIPRKRKRRKRPLRRKKRPLRRRKRRRRSPKRIPQLQLLPPSIPLPL